MVWRKGIKITLLIVGVRLFGDARCSKDQLISSFRKGGREGDRLCRTSGPDISERVAQIRRIPV